MKSASSASFLSCPLKLFFLPNVFQKDAERHPTLVNAEGYRPWVERVRLRVFPSFALSRKTELQGEKVYGKL